MKSKKSAQFKIRSAFSLYKQESQQFLLQKKQKENDKHVHDQIQYMVQNPQQDFNENIIQKDRKSFNKSNGSLNSTENQRKQNFKQQLDIENNFKNNTYYNIRKRKCKKQNFFKQYNDSQNNYNNFQNQEQFSQCYQIKKSFRVETKHITKNYGRAIIGFINRNQSLTKNVLKKLKIKESDYSKQLQKCKKNIFTLKGLRSMWINKQSKYAKANRILSYTFLRKHCLNYIFYSRVQHQGLNLKYRAKMLEGITDPESFTYMKEF